MAITAATPAQPVKEEVLRRIPRTRETIDARLYLLINGLPHTRYWDDQIELLSDLGKGIGWDTGSCWLALRDGSRGRRANDHADRADVHHQRPGDLYQQQQPGLPRWQLAGGPGRHVTQGSGAITEMNSP